jgi:hypothetical protein
MRSRLGPASIPDMERPPQDELGEIVDEYHHLQAEYRHAGAEGRVRRHLGDRLEELEQRFEGLLAYLVPDAEARAEWRGSLHHGWPSPPPAVWPPELLFRGVTETGSVVEIRAGAGDEAEVMVDGRLAERLVGEITGDVIALDGHTFEETFAASPAALLALGEWVDEPAGEPPRAHAWELLGDGLIDRHFGLTPRGRRALRRSRA